MKPRERSKLIQQHLDAILELEAEEAAQLEGAPWPPKGYYWLFHLVVGSVIGMIGASVSLMMNVVGSLMVDRHPLDLVRIYLTFPMGEAAKTTESGKILFVGCCLYLVTGGLFGIVFHFVMSWYFEAASFKKRFVVTSLFGLALWIVNFYLILSWLQPALLDGNWIITDIPFWVAAATHLVFVWTMLIVEAWGRFEAPLALTSQERTETPVEQEQGVNTNE